MSMQRIDEIEEKLINQVKDNITFEESVNVTEVRNKTALNNKNQMTLEKFKGRFDLIFN